MCSLKKDGSLFEQLLMELDSDVSRFKNTTFRSQDLVSYIDHRTGCETHMSAGRYLAIESLRSGLIKKYVGSAEEADYDALNKVRHDVCVKKFLDRNAFCEEFNNTYDPSQLDSFTAVVRGEVLVLLGDILDNQSHPILSISRLAQGLRVGPGASSDVSGDAGTFGRCMNNAMSFSSKHVYSMYRACTFVSPLTFRAEAVRHGLYGEYDLHDSQATFLSVLKNGEENRAICKQPSGNMLLQLSIHEILSDTLKRHFDCDLSTQQEKNRILAFLGSLDTVSCQRDSWSFCTLDLKSASDFPLVLIQDMFPEVWSMLLLGVRSPTLDVDGTSHVKHMMSSMGNGFTFALMTLFLSAIVKVLYRLADLPEYDVTFREFAGKEIDPDKIQTSAIGGFKTWAVYGDDIIVDRRVWNGLNKVLSAFGFTVNEKKSYSTGFFRESCGGDFYQGVNVRPVFCQSLANDADIYSLLNRLTSWGFYHSVELPNTLRFLRGAIKGDELRVPNWEDVCAGIHVPSSLKKGVPPHRVPQQMRNAESLGGGRNDEVMTYFYALTPVPQQRAIFYEKSREVLWSSLYGDLFTYDVTYEDDVKWRKTLFKVPKRVRRFKGETLLLEPNRAGVLACMLEGSVRSGRYGIRTNSPVLYETTMNVAPYWGSNLLFSGTATGLRASSGLQIEKLWEEYVRRNVIAKAYVAPVDSVGEKREIIAFAPSASTLNNDCSETLLDIEDLDIKCTEMYNQYLRSGLLTDE